MTSGTIRLPVLPRDLAASIIVTSMVRAARAAGVALLLLAIPVALYMPGREGGLAEAGVPLAALGVMLVSLLALSRYPSTPALIAYLAVGAICTVVFRAAVLGPGMAPAVGDLYLVDLPALSLVLVGTASASPIGAVGWGLAGLITAQGAMLAAAMLSGGPVAVATGPGIAFVNYAAVFVSIAAIQRTHRGRVPEIGQLVKETRALGAQRRAAQRVVALIHDTVLNDLALVMNGPPIVDDRMRQRMREDVAILAGADWSDHPAEAAALDTQAAELRNQLITLASDFQWRDLTVDVSFDDSARLSLTPESTVAAVGAVRACLENVLKHSGAKTAELVVGGSDGRVTLMVVDSGVGFDRAQVPADRLGLRSSVVRRIESAGGSVRIWSAVDLGTSVLLSLPVAESTGSVHDA